MSQPGSLVYPPIQQTFEFLQQLPQRLQMLQPIIDVSIDYGLQNSGPLNAEKSAPGEFLDIATMHESFEAFDLAIHTLQLFLELIWIGALVTFAGMHAGE